MSEWKDISSVFEYIGRLDRLVTRDYGWDTWGPVLVWATEGKDAPKIYEAYLVENKNPKGKSYWKDARREDDNYEIVPSHWRPMLEPPK